MITRELLEKVTRIVVHENNPGAPCPDGTASALILRDALPDATILFTSHANLVRIEPGPNTLFCDITPPDVLAPMWLEHKPIVLDHHVKQKDVTLKFGELAQYSDAPGISGATLAFLHVWHTIYPGMSHDDPTTYQRVQNFALRAGVRDTWQKTHPWWEAACMQGEALQFYPWAAWPRETFTVNADDFEDKLALGETLWARRKETARNLAAEAFIGKSRKGTSYAVINSIETSDVAELVDVDVLVGFHYHLGPAGSPVVQFSFRARKGYDVGALATSLGGGGHKAAAGATLAAGDGAPLIFIRTILDSFENP